MFAFRSRVSLMKSFVLHHHGVVRCLLTVISLVCRFVYIHSRKFKAWSVIYLSICLSVQLLLPMLVQLHLLQYLQCFDAVAGRASGL